jgi:hypothetical protein
VQRIAADHHDAGLDPTDADVFQVVLAAAARCFFSTVIEAVGTEPDSHYRTSVEPELQQVLTVGRPIAAAEMP